MASLIISGPYFWSGIARPGPTLPPPLHTSKPWYIYYIYIYIYIYIYKATLIKFIVSHYTGWADVGGQLR